MARSWRWKTPEVVAEIRRMRAGGKTQAQLAAAFGISQSTVSEITRGKSYRNFGGEVLPQNFNRVNCTAEEIRAIRAMRGLKTWIQIASHFNRSPSTIYRIFHKVIT